MFQLANHRIFDALDAPKKILVYFAEECLSPRYFSRPRAGKLWMF